MKYKKINKQIKNLRNSLRNKKSNRINKSVEDLYFYKR